jgi:hypothetical protein
MGTMGKYCKAYLVKQLRSFEHWREKSENAQHVKEVVDGHEIIKTRSLTDDDVLYLQENYIVTDGIFKDTNIIFDEVTPEWIEYCQNELVFALLVDELVID